VDLWYGSTQDLEWYDPQQVTTRGGALVITMDSVNTTQPGLTPGSTAPFTVDENHGLGYRSGMLQSWNKFCFTTGYIEVAVTFPGPDQSTQGYVSLCLCSSWIADR
jgi:beta-glucanase (GH16 family)